MTAIDTILSIDTAAAVIAKGLDLASGLGLPVTTWRTGDPTKSLYAFLARILAGTDTDRNEKGLSGIIVGYGQSAILSRATGDWLTILAKEVYGVDRVLATPATSTVTLHNTGGGLYPRVAGDLTVKCSESGATYHSTSGGTLTAGSTLTFTVSADLDGSIGSAPTNGIDTLVTSLPGVVVTLSTVAIGTDGQTNPELRTQCTSTLGALSPNGPADAYECVCRNPKLTGVTDIARARAIGDDTTGQVTVYVAGAAGPVAGASLIAAQAAVQIWATPLCITPSVTDASPVTINVTTTITGPGIPGSYATTLSTALAAALSAFDIAGAAGDIVDTTLITAVMRAAIPQIVTIAMSVPSAPIALSAGEYPVLGTVAITAA